MCDQILPSMDGLSLLHSVREAPRLEEVPFFVISVHHNRSFNNTCHWFLFQALCRHRPSDERPAPSFVVSNPVCLLMRGLPSSFDLSDGIDLSRRVLLGSSHED